GAGGIGDHDVAVGKSAEIDAAKDNGRQHRQNQGKLDRRRAAAGPAPTQAPCPRSPHDQPSPYDWVLRKVRTIAITLTSAPPIPNQTVSAQLWLSQRNTTNASSNRSRSCIPDPRRNHTPSPATAAITPASRMLGQRRSYFRQAPPPISRSTRQQRRARS